MLLADTFHVNGFLPHPNRGLRHRSCSGAPHSFAGGPPHAYREQWRPRTINETRQTDDEATT